MEIIIQQENQIEWGTLNASMLKANKDNYIWLWNRIIEDNLAGDRNDSREALIDAQERLEYWDRSDIEILSEELKRLEDIQNTINSRPKDYKYYVELLNEE